MASIIADLETATAMLNIRIDGQRCESCDGQALIQTLNSSLQWLSAQTADRNEPLQAGQIILTGSVPDLIPVNPNCTIQVDAPPLGTVEATFV